MRSERVVIDFLFWSAVLGAVISGWKINNPSLCILCGIALRLRSPPSAMLLRPNLHVALNPPFAVAPIVKPYALDVGEADGFHAAPPPSGRSATKSRMIGNCCRMLYSAQTWCLYRYA